MTPNAKERNGYISKDDLRSGLILLARLFLIYFALIVVMTITIYVELVLIPGRSGSIVKVFRWSAFGAAALFIFILPPTVRAMQTNRGFLHYFWGAAAGLAVCNLIQAALLALSGTTLIQYGVAFYKGGLITAWGLLEAILSLAVFSLVVAFIAKTTEFLTGR